MPPCLTLSIIRYGSRVKWRNPGKGVASSPTPWCSSYRKRCLRVTLDYGRQLYIYIWGSLKCLSLIFQPYKSQEKMCPDGRKVRLPSLKRDVLGITRNCIWWWGSSSVECVVPLHCHYSQDLFKFPLKKETVRFPSMSQIDLFANCSY